MRIETAREIKAELWRSAAEGTTPGAPRPVLPCFVGVSVLGRARYGVAIRYVDSAGAALADRAASIASGDVDVREVGRVRTQATALPQSDPDQWTAAALQQRVRPLRPGASVGHHAGSAGTLGGFVTVRGHDGVQVLSNSHILADCGRASPGEHVVQPGRSDGGTPADAVGRLTVAVPLQKATANVVDGAVARLDDGAAIDARYPSGRLTGWGGLDLDDLDSDRLVEKVGRTTGVTRGRVTAVELDDVTVGFPGMQLTFDGQLEVTGERGPFSAGGDSGAVVYVPDTMRAVGLLFAGSERGGSGGAGLTYCNPIGVVLDALGATLVG